MVISRKLAHKVQNQLQLVMAAIELGTKRQALDQVHALSELVNRYIETPEEEAARTQRDAQLR